MTRTSRADYPRAVLKDRSESRSGRDPSIRKDGAGQHNWGSIADEQQLEFNAIEDELREAGLEEAENMTALKTATVSPTATASEEPELVPGNADISDEELEKALQYRKHAFKKQGKIDLVHIARTSAAVAGAPRLSNGVARRPSQDNRMANAPDATISV